MIANTLQLALFPWQKQIAFDKNKQDWVYFIALMESIDLYLLCKGNIFFEDFDWPETTQWNKKWEFQLYLEKWGFFFWCDWYWKFSIFMA